MKLPQKQPAPNRISHRDSVVLYIPLTQEAYRTLFGLAHEHGCSALSEARQVMQRVLGDPLPEDEDSHRHGGHRPYGMQMTPEDLRALYGVLNDVEPI